MEKRLGYPAFFYPAFFTVMSGGHPVRCSASHPWRSYGEKPTYAPARTSALRPCATPLRCAILLRLRTGPSHPWLGRSLLERSSPCSACVPAQTLHGLGVRCSIAAHPCSARSPEHPSLDARSRLQVFATRPVRAFERLRWATGPTVRSHPWQTAHPDQLRPSSVSSLSAAAGPQAPAG